MMILKCYKYIIDSLIKVAEVDLIKNNIDETVLYIEKIQFYAENVDYVSGIIRSQGFLAAVYDIRQEYSKVRNYMQYPFKTLQR